MRYHGIKEGFWCKVIERPFMIQEASKLSGPSSTQRAHTAKLPVGSCFHTYATSGIAICPAPWSKQSPGLTGKEEWKRKNMIETHTSHKVLLTFQVLFLYVNYFIACFVHLSQVYYGRWILIHPSFIFNHAHLTSPKCNKTHPPRNKIIRVLFFGILKHQCPRWRHLSSLRLSGCALDVELLLLLRQALTSETAVPRKCHQLDSLQFLIKPGGTEKW